MLRGRFTVDCYPAALRLLQSKAEASASYLNTKLARNFKTLYDSDADQPENAVALSYHRDVATVVDALCSTPCYGNALHAHWWH